MKILINSIRVFVGCLYIFSGLVKAIDPRGLAYKMQEFFEVWAADGYLTSFMNYLNEEALFISIFMIALEILLGIALLVGWKKHFTLWILLLLTTFFTFLTSYVLFSGKIRACGCFGDCIPLTPIQTFSKDVLLMVLIISMLIFQKYILPLFKNLINGLIVLVGVLAALFLQFYVLKHLPIKDCLPYKKGNNILELRKMPADAVPDKFDYSFIYEKNGEKKTFTMAQLPDSTWTFVDRKQVLIQKGKNNVPIINDFSLSDSTGIDQTENILSYNGVYYLFFVKNFSEGTARWEKKFERLYQSAQLKQIPFFIVTPEPDKAQRFFNIRSTYKISILTIDGVAFKTAARSNPTLFKFKGPIIQNKLSWADMEQIDQ
ncbi:MAG: BT_3928 family protein [Ferruginibacter sp.]